MRNTITPSIGDTIYDVPLYRSWRVTAVPETNPTAPGLYTVSREGSGVPEMRYTLLKENFWSLSRPGYQKGGRVDVESAEYERMAENLRSAVRGPQPWTLENLPLAEGIWFLTDSGSFERDFNGTTVWVTPETHYGGWSIYANSVHGSTLEEMKGLGTMERGHRLEYALTHAEELLLGHETGD